MTEQVQQSIVDLYDAYVRSCGDEAAKSADAKQAIHEQVRDLLALLDRDLDREAWQLINSTITAERDKRSRHFKKNIEWLLDGLGEDGAFIDPLLDMAFSTGADAGIDKALRFWKADDFRELTVTRYRVAADATAAAADLDQAVQRLINRMNSEGAEFVGDIEWTTP